MKLLVHSATGPENPTRAALALLVARTAVEEGHDVRVFLAGDPIDPLAAEPRPGEYPHDPGSPRAAGDGTHGRRLRGLVVVLWRAGLRIQAALALAEADLTRAAARCSSGAARADVAAKSAWGRSCTRSRRLPAGVTASV